MTTIYRRWDAIACRLPRGVPLVGAEVGVWTGKCCSRLLAIFPLLRLYLVDRWCPPPAGDSYCDSGAQMAGYDRTVYDNALAQTRSKCAPYARRCTYLIGDSVAMAERVAGGSLDFCFIDGDHSYTGCLRDIRAWAPKVKEGGWLCGHDYDHPEQGEVKRAVTEWLAGRGGLELDCNRTWFWKTEGGA